MNNEISELEFFEEIQHELDNKFLVQAKKEFDLKLEYQNSIKDLLETRDNFIKKKQEKGQLLNFWETAFLNYDISMDILPVDTNNKCDASWIKSILVEYQENYVCYVRLELYENEYVENTVLEKRMCLSDNEVELSKIDWKGNNKCPMLLFFEIDDEEYELFDCLYEIYINGCFYYTLEN